MTWLAREVQFKRLQSLSSNIDQSGKERTKTNSTHVAFRILKAKRENYDVAAFQSYACWVKDKRGLGREVRSFEEEILDYGKARHLQEAKRRLRSKGKSSEKIHVGFTRNYFCRSRMEEG